MLEDLYPSEELQAISMGMTQPWGLQTPPRGEQNTSAELPLPLKPGTRLTSIGVENIHLNSDRLYLSSLTSLLSVDSGNLHSGHSRLSIDQP